MKHKIGIYGSNTRESDTAVLLSQMLGEVLAKNDLIVITGGCSGMPYVVASAAKRKGAEVFFSPKPDEIVSLLLKEIS